MKPRRVMVYSVADMAKARVRLKKQRMERLPRAEDLPVLEAAAIRDMAIKARELGVG